MNNFVESLKRLYTSKQITESKVNDLFKNKKITETERNYILGKE